MSFAEIGVGQALVERLHARLSGTGLHRRIDLVNLVFANQVANRGVGIRTSMIMARPRPSARGRSAWQRMPSSTMESCARICGCWWDGKTSIIRLMVEVAELVCSVAKVKWPVSAMRKADSMVSRSRISPISTTSGSSRSAARSEFANEWVSAWTSRWFTRHFL